MNIRENISLLHYNTFGMDVTARYYSALEHTDELEHIREMSPGQDNIFLLGGGSNVLFTKDVDAWVIHNKIKGIEKVKEDEDYIWIKANAGEVWHQFVLYCVANNYGGLENLSLIPGTAGAAPIQNIGAYGVEVKDVIAEVHYYDLENGSFVILNNRDCKFGYRDSVFKHSLKGKAIITAVMFKLAKKPVPNISYGAIKEELEHLHITALTIKAVSDAVINIRSSKLPDPKYIGNAGSFFKNPEVNTEQYNALKNAYPAMPAYHVDDQRMKIPAAWLIEQCGWKGFRRDSYGVHERQALVLVNYGQANGNDICQLSQEIIESVSEQFGIELMREVQIF